MDGTDRIKQNIMKVKEFINNVLINEIKDIQQKEGHHYLSFGLISQGVEFLGACLDNNDFNVKNKSKERFNKAIKELFPDDYKQYVKNRTTDQFDLYGNLKCGLLHIVVPGSDIELIQTSEISYFGNNLDEKIIRGKKRLILVSEIFMSDFEDACKEVIHRIDNNIFSHSKMYNDIISTTP